MNDSGRPGNLERSAGSPSVGEPVFLVVGKIHRPFGLRGELLMGIQTDFPERLQPRVTVYVGDDHVPLDIHAIREHGRLLRISFDGLTNPEEAGEYRNQFVYVRADDRPQLPEGEFYHHQLIGLHVVSDEGDILGILTKIIETGANDVYVVRSENDREVLLPAIESVILDIDLERSEMRVRVLPGLIPEG